MASTEQIALQLQKLANQSTEKSFQYNTKEANTARTWQKMMSDTSHQREVADLKKAGLNPVLSAGGSGAQSYTTSAASASADNAVNAIGGVYSSKIGADAQRAAAAQSAAAMRYSAQIQASAARYAAAMNYQASVYKADKSYEQTKLAWKYKKDIAFNAPTGNPIKIIDRLLYNMGLYDSFTNNMKLVAKDIVKQAQTDPTSLLKKNAMPTNGAKITAKNFKVNMLNSYSTAQLGKIAKGLGIENNSRNRGIIFKAFGLNDVSSQIILKSIYNNSRLSNYAKLRKFNRI